MEIVNNKALKLRLRKPDRVTTVIPKSKIVGQVGDIYEVLVHWGHDECLVLKNLGIKNVPSPINKDYPWHGLYKPFAHQKETAAFLTLHKRAFCLNEMGCVDSETEYLSPTGWVKISEYAGGQVAQYHPDSREIEFVDPIEYIKKPCATMIRFVGNGFDQLLSPEHRVLIYREDGSHVVSSAVKVLRGWLDGSLKTSYIWNGESMIRFLDFKEINDVYYSDSTDGFKYCFSVPSTFLLFRRNGCVFASGNTGKTSSILWAADYLMTKGYIRRVMVVCPLSIMHSAWKADAFKTVMHRTVDIAHGNRTKRLEVIRGKSDIVIINYDGIEIVADAIKSAGFDLIVIDECFPKGTKISTPFGCKNIEDITEGDIVDSSWGPRPVTKVFKKQAKELVEVSFNDGRKIRCTPDHPFATERGWVKAKDIEGEWCIDSKELPSLWGVVENNFSLLKDLLERGTIGASSDRVRVDSVTYIQQDSICDVWNLEVDGPNDYIVNGVLVHNCNHYKNTMTKRWKIMNGLLGANTWLWGLTGSPASQSPMDAYGLAKLMNPNSVPKYPTAFRDIVMSKLTQFKYIPRPSAMDTVHKVLQPAIRFTKEECLDLPPRMYVTREVPLSAQQTKYYKLLKEQMRIQAAGEEVTTANAAINLNKLMQIASGAAYSDTKEVVEFDCANRLNVLEEIIEEASKKVIVFATFKHTIARLEDFLTSRGYTVGVVHGGIPVHRRADIFEAFQTTPDPHVLIIQPRSASHGVTLTAANVIVWWSPTPSVETYLQANDRVHRAGQDSPCTVVHLTGSPVEDKFYKALEQKSNLLDDLLGLYKDILES